MENAFGIVLPDEFTDELGIRRLRPHWIELGRVPDDLLPAQQVLFAAQRQAPSFEEQLYPYLTEEELAKYIGYPVRTTTIEQLVGKVAQLPFPGAMRRLAWLQRELWALPLDNETQIGAARTLYGPTVGELCARFLRARDRGVILCDTQLFALQRLVMLHARDAEPEEELDKDGMVTLLSALIAVPGTILGAADTDLDVPLTPEATVDIGDEEWLRFFIGTGGLSTNSSLDHAVARARLLYRVIANSRAARKWRDFCPFDEWLVEEYGFDFTELQAIGLAMLAGFHSTLSEGPPVLIDPHFFSTTTFATRGQQAVEAVSAPRDWYRAEFGRSPQTPRRAAREILPFLLRPALRQKDEKAAVIAPRALEGWLSATGTYWRLWHIAKKKERLDAFFHFHGFLFERYGRHLAYVAHPEQKRRRLLGTAGIVHTEVSYAHEGESKTSDIAIDLGTDLVLVEMTAKRLTAGSLLDAKVETIRDDLNAMVIENMRQLGRVIGHLADKTATIPGIDMNIVKTIWPVIVAPESALQSPTFWAYIERTGGHFLDEARKAVVQDVKPPVVLELEEYERLMGIARETGKLRDVLERKTHEVWRQRDFKSWLRGDPFAIGTGESEFIQQEWGRANREIRRVLGIHSTDKNGETGRQRALAA